VSSSNRRFTYLPPSRIVGPSYSSPSKWEVTCRHLISMPSATTSTHALRWHKTHSWGNERLRILLITYCAPPTGLSIIVVQKRPLPKVPGLESSLVMGRSGTVAIFGLVSYCALLCRTCHYLRCIHHILACSLAPPHKVGQESRGSYRLCRDPPL
jgi:hypothetical protein